MQQTGAPSEWDEYELFSRGSSYRPGYVSVADRIVALIDVELYKEGDRLPTELELSKTLQVGRSVVREALKVLSALGYVTVRRGSGIYAGPRVASPLRADALVLQPDQAERLFEFRLLLEPATAALAASRLTVSRLQSLRGALAMNREGVSKADIHLFVRGDLALHIGIAEASGNPFITLALRQSLRFQQSITRMILGSPPGSLPNASDEHEEVLKALEAGDADRAAAAMRKHINSSMTGFQAAVRRRLLEYKADGKA